MKKVPITNNFSQDITHMMGYAQFDENSDWYKLFKSNPQAFVFAPSFYIKKTDGNTIQEAELIEISMIPVSNVVPPKGGIVG